MIGHKGNELGTFNYPNQVVVDDEGNIVVCDVKNQRLQVMRESEDGEEFIALIKPNINDDKKFSFARPFISFLDTKRRKLYVGNKLSRTVVRYSFHL